MRQWLENYRSAFEDAILAGEGPSSATPNCYCGRVADWRCDDCLGCQPLCLTCLHQSHQLLPWHRVSKWHADGYYSRSSLPRTSLRLHCGHEGRICPVRSEANVQAAHDSGNGDQHNGTPDFPPSSVEADEHNTIPVYQSDTNMQEQEMAELTEAEDNRTEPIDILKDVLDLNATSINERSNATGTTMLLGRCIGVDRFAGPPFYVVPQCLQICQERHRSVRCLPELLPHEAGKCHPLSISHFSTMSEQTTCKADYSSRLVPQTNIQFFNHKVTVGIFATCCEGVIHSNRRLAITVKGRLPVADYGETLTRPFPVDVSLIEGRFFAQFCSGLDFVKCLPGEAQEGDSNHCPLQGLHFRRP